MKRVLGLVVIILTLLVISRLNPIELVSARLLKGQRIYVPIYSSIYVGDQHKLLPLTSTLSIRNVSTVTNITLTQIEYYDSDGKLLKAFALKPILLGPLATKDIVVPEFDLEGGTGANFLVRWESEGRTPAPIVEAVMLGSVGKQSYSFLSRGEEIEVE